MQVVQDSEIQMRTIEEIWGDGGSANTVSPIAPQKREDFSCATIEWVRDGREPEETAPVSRHVEAGDAPTWIGFGEILERILRAHVHRCAPDKI